MATKRKRASSKKKSKKKKDGKKKSVRKTASRAAPRREPPQRGAQLFEPSRAQDTQEVLGGLRRVLERVRASGQQPSKQAGRRGNGSAHRKRGCAQIVEESFQPDPVMVGM